MKSLKTTFMKMILALMATLFLISAQAQVSSHEAIQLRLDKFISLTNTKEYNAAFDLMYPKLFSTVGKQELVDLMSAMDTDGLSLTINNRRDITYSSPVMENDETFIRIDFNADVIMKVKEGTMYDSYKALQAMRQQFAATYGEENVSLSEDNRTFTISADKSMIAVQKGGGEWYLVEINPDQAALMETLFSPYVRKELGITQ